MKNAVEAIFQQGPPGNDWIDPDIRPNIMALLSDAGIIRQTLGVECYDRVAFPARERSEELAALRKQLLDEKVEAGVIPEEVADKIASVPDPKPGTPAEARAYQLKVRRATRLLYKAGELDSATVKKLEAAVGMPIVNLDPEKALRADVTYLLQGRLSRQWPADARKAIVAALAKHGVANEIKTHRGEMQRGAQVLPGVAKVQVDAVAKLLADPDYNPELRQDKDAAPVLPVGIVHDFMRVRRAIRILIVQGGLVEEDAAAFSTLLGVPIFGKIEELKFLDPPPGPTCYMVENLLERGSAAPKESCDMRLALRDKGILSPAAVRKLDEADKKAN